MAFELTPDEMLDLLKNNDIVAQTMKHYETYTKIGKNPAKYYKETTLTVQTPTGEIYTTKFQTPGLEQKEPPKQLEYHNK